MPSPTPLPAVTPALCRHTRMSGQRCHALALKGQAFCYSHGMTFTERCQDRAARPSRRPPTPELLFRLSNLDDFHVIQYCLSAILSGLAANALGPRRATPMVRALNIASRNTAARLHDTSLPQAPKGTPEERAAEALALVRLIAAKKA